MMSQENEGQVVVENVEAGATAPAPKVEPQGESQKGTVPYARFAEKASEVKLWKDQVEELRARVGEVDVWKTKATEWEQKYTAAESTWAEERAFASTGMADPDAMELARFYFGKLAEKPEGGIGEWLSGLKADPSTAPKALAAYLAPPEAEAPAPSREAPRASVRTPTGRGPTTEGVVTTEALRAAREQAQKSGDWAAFKQLSAAFAASTKR